MADTNRPDPSGDGSFPAVVLGLIALFVVAIPGFLAGIVALLCAAVTGDLDLAALLFRGFFLICAAVGAGGPVILLIDRWR